MKNSSSIMVILGLLGTFCGLTMSVGELSDMLTQTGSENWMSLLDKAGSGLMDSISGMATAFSTSLAGIACSMVLTVSGTFINAEGTGDEFMTEMEDYLDNVLYNYISDDFKKKDDKLYFAVNKALGDFGDRMEKIIARYSLTPARTGRIKNEIA